MQHSKNNLKVDVIVPILRGGGFLGLKLAFAFRVVRIIPFQYKYFLGKKEHELKKIYDSQFSQLINFKKKHPVVLIVEGNHSSGQIAGKVVLDVKKQLPDSTIIYVSLARDYFYKDSVKNTDFSTTGYYTNENRKLDKETCQRLGINFQKINLFPWESQEEELAMLNNTRFEYRDQEEF